MANKRNDADMFDTGDEIEDLGEIMDAEPAPSRRNPSARAAVNGNHRRSIEEIQEQRRLRNMLSDLEQDFPDLL